MWALITHPAHLALWTQGTVILPTAIQERDLHWALAQGWSVIGRDSAVSAPAPEVPVQSNPRRPVHGHSAVRDTGED